MSTTRRRPSLGTVLGIVAVLIATSSAAFAAGAIITKSSQIKNGVVTGADLKNGSVAAKDLKTPKWRTVGVAGQPIFQSSYDHVDSPYHLVSFRKGADGRVYLRGAAQSPNDLFDPSALFKLPPGYRPKLEVLLPVVSSDGDGLLRLGAIAVATNGQITVSENTDDHFLSLDGLSFEVD